MLQNFLHIPTAASLLIAIGAVYTIMLAVKQNDWVKANVNGWWAVALNLILSALSILVLVPVNQLYTLNTLVTLIVTLLSSSGVHGMVKSVPNSSSEAPSTPLTADIKSVTKIIAFFILAVTLGMVGCVHAGTAATTVPGAVNDFDATTYRGLSDMQAVIKTTEADVAAGKVTLSASEQTVFTTFKNAYNTAEQAWQVYHASATSANEQVVVSAYSAASADYGSFINIRKAPSN